MSDNLRLIPRAALKGTATGLCLMTFFTLIWSGIAYGGLSAGRYWPCLLIFPVLCIFFLIGAIRLFRIAKYFPEHTSAEDIAREKQTGTWFGIIFGAEGLGIFAGINLVVHFGHPELTVPVIALVVGLHFFPMARLFRRTVDYYLGAYTTLVAIAALVLGFEKVFSQPETFAFTGTGLAIATSCYGGYMLLAGRNAAAALKSRA